MKDEHITIGKLGSAYGVKGWIKVIPYNDSAVNILEYKPWYLKDGMQWKEISVDDAKAHGKGYVIKFSEINSPEQARLFTGKILGVLRSQLPVLKENEFYWTDLEGLTVINQDDKELGVIIYLMETGSNDVLVVKGEKEHAIPYLMDEVILKVDLPNKIMHVRWDEL